MPADVRPMLEADLDAVAALERRCFGDPWSRRAFLELLAFDHIGALVLEGPGGSVAAYAVWSRAADEGEILNLAVAPELRRTGAGRRLLAAVLEWLSSAGARRVFLEVRRSNAAAIALYSTAGFATLGVRIGYYRRPTEDAVTMVRELGSEDA